MNYPQNPPHTVRWMVVVWALLGILLESNVVFAVEYQFEKVADSSGVYKSFTTSTAGPSINDLGDVVFPVELDNGHLRLELWSDGVTQTLATSNGLSPYRSQLFAIAPAINNQGDVLFYAVSFTTGFGIFTGPDPAVDVVADQSGPFSGFGNYPWNNDAGSIMFQATSPGGVNGLYRGPDPVGDKIIDNSGPFSSFSQFSLNDEGEFAFVAFLDAGGSGVFSGLDPVADRVADTSGPFSSFQGPHLNNNGDLIFRAQLDSGVTGIYSGPDPVADKLVSTEDGFEILGGGWLNDNGQFVFGALYDEGKVGIFTGTDPVADRLIGVGDPLFGSTVTAITSYQGLNNAGQIVFGYALDNGEQGVIIASPHLSGDHNNDGVVDAADYIAWRKNDGSIEGYNAWIAGYGNSGEGSTSAVPEPATSLLISVWSCAACAVRAPRKKGMPG